MSDINFEAEEDYTRPQGVGQARGMTQLLIKWHLAKDERQAQYVMLGIAATSTILAIFVFFSFVR